MSEKLSKWERYRRKFLKVSGLILIDKSNDFSEFDLLLNGYEFQDKHEFWDLHYQNGLSVKENVKLFKEWVKED